MEINFLTASETEEGLFFVRHSTVHFLTLDKSELMQYAGENGLQIRKRFDKKTGKTVYYGEPLEETK